MPTAVTIHLCPQCNYQYDPDDGCCTKCRWTPYPDSVQKVLDQLRSVVSAHGALPISFMLDTAHLVANYERVIQRAQDLIDAVDKTTDMSTWDEVEQLKIAIAKTRSG